MAQIAELFAFAFSIASKAGEGEQELDRVVFPNLDYIFEESRSHWPELIWSNSIDGYEYRFETIKDALFTNKDKQILKLPASINEHWQQTKEGIHKVHNIFLLKVM